MDRDHATTEAINILQNVLTLPSIISSIADSVESNVSRSAHQREAESEAELRTLFRPSTPAVQSINNGQTMPTSSAGALHGPRFHARQQYGNWQSRSRKRPRTQYHQTFNKDVILLTSPHDNVVLKQKNKQHLHYIGHILNAFEFDKAWDSATVLKKNKRRLQRKSAT